MRRQQRKRRGRRKNDDEIWRYLCIIAIIIAIIYVFSYGIYYLTVITYGLIWIPVIVIIILIIYKKSKGYNLKKKREYEQKRLKQLKESNIREMQAAQRKFRIFQIGRASCRERV